jgi:hypothetical protein
MHVWSHDDIGMRFFRIPFSLSSLGAGARTMIGGGKVSNSYANKNTNRILIGLHILPSTSAAPFGSILD